MALEFCVSTVLCARCNITDSDPRKCYPGSGSKQNWDNYEGA